MAHSGMMVTSTVGYRDWQKPDANHRALSPRISSNCPVDFWPKLDDPRESGHSENTAFRDVCSPYRHLEAGCEVVKINPDAW
jgi:hypothetical protein